MRSLTTMNPRAIHPDRSKFGFALLTLAAVILVGCGPARTPRDAASPSPSPSASSDEPSFSVLFLKTDTRKSSTDEIVGIFEGQPPSPDVRSVIEGKAPRRLYPSRDGRFVAWATFEDETASRLLVAQGSALTEAKTIADSSDRISSVSWSDTGDHIAFFTSPIRDDGGMSDGMEHLRVIKRDGSDGRAVATFELGGAHVYRTIIGFETASSSVLWTFETREGAGGARGLARTDLETGKTTTIGGDTGVVYTEMTLSPDFKKLYYVRAAGTLRERDLAAQTERTVYQVDESRECAIDAVLVDPSGDSVIVSTTPTPVIQSACTKDPGMPQATTLRLSLEGSEKTTLDSGSPDEATRAESISPDGRFLWLGNDGSSREIAIMDLASKQLIPYVDQDDWASRWFLAWVRAA